MFPQAGIPCSWRAREPTAEKALPHSQTFRRLWFKPSQQQRPRDGRNAISGSWRGERDLRLWRRALVGARRISRASAFGKRRAFCACSSFSRKSFAVQNRCGSPAISPPGCSVCAHPICFLTIRAQTARFYFGLRPRASRLRNASASGHPLLVAGARASTLKSLSKTVQRKRELTKVNSLFHGAVRGIQPTPLKGSPRLSVVASRLA